MKEYRSFSQLNDYETCPERYRLKRIARAWERPAAWLPHGTAVHAAVEAYEKSERTMPEEDVVNVFVAEYVKEINRYAEQTPNFEYWSTSGPYKGLEDTERRYRVGKDQVRGYIAYVRNNPDEKIWVTPDGQLAVELEFDILLGSVPVRGYIDQIVTVTLPDGRILIIVRDVKSGATPGETVQLKLYSVSVEDTYGVPVELGDYWMGKDKKPTKRYDLTTVTRNELVDRFGLLDENIREERFDPTPDPKKCGRCPFNSYCKYVAM